MNPADNILEDEGRIAELLRSTRRIAVLGIKTEAQADQAAFYVPAYLQSAGAEVIPLDDFAERMHELDSAQDIVLICRSGTRSTQALMLLRNAGFRKVKNLHGGVNAWAEQVDPKQAVY
jgi:rhodanese-related sulfurtransferase